MGDRFNIQQFGQRDWIKHWAGPWKLLNNSYLGFQYTKLLKEELGSCFKLAMFISHRGYTVAYLDLADYKKFGAYLANKIIRDSQSVKVWCEELKRRADLILGLINQLRKKKEVKAVDYQKFKQAFYDYGVPHRVIKVVVDSLSPERLRQHLSELTAARVYAEPVYAETEKFMEFVAGQISRQSRIKKELILSVTKDEFDDYWQNGKLPPVVELKRRYLSSALLYESGRAILLTGQTANQLEKLVESSSGLKKAIHGFTAYPGVVKGRARIIFNPKISKNFKDGDILLTGMTRPEYLYLIKKSAGFVTDAGGMLSHAAITARELHKLDCFV